MTRFPPIAPLVGTAEFSVQENVVGPDDDEDDDDSDGNGANFAEPEEL